jgi:hypothetical protein
MACNLGSAHGEDIVVTDAPRGQVYAFITDFTGCFSSVDGSDVLTCRMSRDLRHPFKHETTGPLVCGRGHPQAGKPGVPLGEEWKSVPGSLRPSHVSRWRRSTPSAESLTSGAQIPGHEVEAGDQLIEPLICQITGRSLAFEVATADDDEAIGIRLGAGDDHAPALAEHQRGIQLGRLQQFPDIVSLDKGHD